MKQNKTGRLNVILKACIALVCMNMFMCAAKSYVELDTQTRVVFQKIEADRVFKDFLADEKAAKAKYADKYYSLYGIVLTNDKKGKEITLGATDDHSTGKITCKFSDKEDIAFAAGLAGGDIVRVYGKITVGFKNALSMKDLRGIAKAEVVNGSDDTYSVFGGSEIKRSSMSKKSIEGSSVVFYVPPEWEGVEHDIKAEKLGSLSGYQYRLNEIHDKDAYAESLFICYFDKNIGVDKNSRSDNKLIEEAILRDILGKESLKKFPLKSITTYYGAKYKYYRDIFTKAIGDKYQIEAVFQEKEDGILLYFYVYKEPKHVDDIMVVMRLLEF